MAKETIIVNNFEKAILSCGAVFGWIGNSYYIIAVVYSYVPVSGTGLAVLGNSVPGACWCVLV